MSEADASNSCCNRKRVSHQWHFFWYVDTVLWFHCSHF